jgi:hypothetical protein
MVTFGKGGMAEGGGERQVWKSISAALNVEMREATTIRGASGQDHPVQAIAVDDAQKRIIVFSAEPSPRIAALMQLDVRATIPDAHVIVARPVIFDLSEMTRRIVAMFGQDGTATVKDIVNAFQPKTKNKKRAQAHTDNLLDSTIVPALKPMFETASRVRLPFSTQVMDIFQQIASLDWPSQLKERPSLEGFLQLLLSTVAVDSAEPDRKLGICPIPMFGFSDADYELLLSGTDIDAVRQRLKEVGIFQYFYPPPDHLLLSLADKRIVENGSIVGAAQEAPAHGHPLGEPEIFANRATLLDTLEQLKEAGYVAEGELGITVTEKGREIRQAIQFRPREGLINKLAKIVSIKLDLSLKDLWRH